MPKAERRDYCQNAQLDLQTTDMTGIIGMTARPQVNGSATKYYYTRYFYSK